jgi:hypothetical protein
MQASEYMRLDHEAAVTRWKITSLFCHFTFCPAASTIVSFVRIHVLCNCRAFVLNIVIMQQEMELAIMSIQDEQTMTRDGKQSCAHGPDMERNVSITSNCNKRSKLQMFVILTALFVRCIILQSQNSIVFKLSKKKKDDFLSSKENSLPF